MPFTLRYLDLKFDLPGVMEASSSYTSYMVDTITSKTVSNSSTVDWHYNIRLFTLSLYARFTIHLLGLLGNLLCLLVMSRKAFRSSQFALFTSVLAISDSIVLVIKMQTPIAYLWNSVTVSSANCVIGVFCFYVFNQCSSWCLVHVTIERFVAVMYPLDVRDIISRKKAILLLLSTTFVLIVINLHVPFHTRVDYIIGCYWTKAFWDSMFYGVYLWTDLLIFSVIPFLIIFPLNCIIVWKLCNRKKIIKASNTSKEIGTVFTLFGISLAFVILSLPTVINALQTLITGEVRDNLALSTIISDVMSDFHFAINFYVYCLTGTKVRRELSLMIMQVLHVCSKGSICR